MITAIPYTTTITHDDLKALSPDQMKALIAKFAAENAALQAKVEAASTRKLSVSSKGEKGTVSVFGLGRFPVSLYAQQWEALFGFQDEVKAFIKANPQLPRK